MEWESKEINRMCTQILAHIVDDQKRIIISYLIWKSRKAKKVKKQPI